MQHKSDRRSRQRAHHKLHHKRLVSRFKKKYRRFAAAALAGAAVMSSSLLPGMATVAHAAVIPHAPPKPSQPAAERQVNPDSQGNLPAANAAPANYIKALDIKATAYAPGAADNGKWGNKTHLGTQVRPGIIAVDPKVIPLGSQVYIQYPDGRGEFAVAEDTGGAIKGNRIDIAKWTRPEAKDFGIKQVKVYVISSPQKA